MNSKLPDIGTTIFTVMSALAQKHGAVNLSQGFPDFDGDPRLKALFKEHIEKGDNQYAPMAGLIELREAIAEKLYHQHGRSYHSESEICVTAGATQAIFTAIQALVHPADEVIIIEPAYDCYAPAIDLCGGVVVRIPLDMEKGDLDTEALDQAITEKTRLIIINTPHNPSGHVFSYSAMTWLEERLDSTDILLLSDEVYEHIIYDGVAHESILRFPKLKERSLLVSSFGKTYHVTGWKMGYCAGPEFLMREFKKVHQFNVFCVNRPVQHALAEFLKDKAAYENLGAFYQEKRDRFLENISSSRFSFRPSAGTYFQMLDYSQISKELDARLAKEWTEKAGIASIPISAFYEQPPEQHYLRFCFAKNDETLQRAAEILCAL